jgi:transposase
MIGAPSGVLIWLVAGVTDLRKGLDSLAALVQNHLASNPFSGDLYVFRGRRGDKVKILWYSGDGVCLYYKRLSDGKFIWPQVQDGTISLSAAQLAMLLEGIDWRRPKRTSPAPQDPDRTHPTQT